MTVNKWLMIEVSNAHMRHWQGRGLVNYATDVCLQLKFQNLLLIGDLHDSTNGMFG